MASDLFFPSSDGVSRIHAREWRPEGRVRAVLQIAHGICEHIERYDGFASFLAESGVLVCGNDHLGHGRSVQSEEELGFFAESGGWGLALRDMFALRQQLKGRYPEAPCFLLGHSMGSFLARTYLYAYPSTLSGCILSGTGQTAPLMVAAGLKIATGEAKRLGLRGRSEKLQKLCFGAYNSRFKPNRTQADWISRDEAMVDRYCADPLTQFLPTVSLVQDMLSGIRDIQRRENLAKMDKSTPVLFFSGENDPVGDAGKGVRRAYASFVKAGCTDVELKLYPCGRHEMLNEINRSEVYADVAAWLEGHIAQSRSAAASSFTDGKV